MATDKIIRVTGLASMMVIPDTTRINVMMKRNLPTYEEAYGQGLSFMQSVYDILQQNGMASTDSKLLKFSVTKPLLDPNEKCRTRDDLRRGYELDQLITIDLALDDVKVRNIVKGIGSYIPLADATLEYIITSPREYKLKVLSTAVKDAADKALVITQALNCRLGKVREITCGSDDYDSAYKCSDTDSEELIPGESILSDSIGKELKCEVQVAWSLLHPDEPDTSAE